MMWRGVRNVAAEHLTAVLERLDERKDVVAHMVQHLFGRQMAELRPAQLLAGPFLAAACLVLSIEQRRGLLLQELGIAATLFIQRVEPPHEQQVADLLDGGQRVGDAARPEAVPELVDFRANNWCQHSVTLATVREPTSRLGPLPR